MTYVGGAINEAHSRNMINICTKYELDILIISGYFCCYNEQTKTQ